MTSPIPAGNRFVIPARIPRFWELLPPRFRGWGKRGTTGPAAGSDYSGAFERHISMFHVRPLGKEHGIFDRSFSGKLTLFLKISISLKSSGLPEQIFYVLSWIFINGTGGTGHWVSHLSS
jgi:hypothetical protein